MTINKPFPISISCQCCHKLLDYIDNEYDAANAGVNPDTGKLDELSFTFCDKCGERFMLTEKIDAENVTEEELRSRVVIGIRRSPDGNYHMVAYSREKLRNDNFKC